MPARVARGIDPSVCEPDARPAVEAFLTLFGTDSPSLDQIWAALDFVWDSIGLDQRRPDAASMDLFYAHPVWLLNGLFIEQHEESLLYRSAFTDWVASRRPGRVADFGGGFGTLGRMIARRLPEAAVEIVEPYPRKEGLRASVDVPNLSFQPALSGTYDVLIATDVFEHVVDAVGLLFAIEQHMRHGGALLAANHFRPSIKCHLPMTFHLEHSWDVFTALAGFRRTGTVAYGSVYEKQRVAAPLARVRRFEAWSRTSHRFCGGSGRAGSLRRKLARSLARRLERDGRPA